MALASAQQVLLWPSGRAWSVFKKELIPLSYQCQSKPWVTPGPWRLSRAALHVHVLCSLAFYTCELPLELWQSCISRAVSLARDFIPVLLLITSKKACVSQCWILVQQEKGILEHSMDCAMSGVIDFLAVQWMLGWCTPGILRIKSWVASRDTGDRCHQRFFPKWAMWA